jgi:hypothetical protein
MIPSKRGELEIQTLTNICRKRKFICKSLNRDADWLDTATF